MVETVEDRTNVMRELWKKSLPERERVQCYNSEWPVLRLVESV